MQNLINYILLLLIIILISYMFYFAYKCKKRDNQLLIEKYYNFYNKKNYEKFVDFNREQNTLEQNQCIDNWININDGMDIYLNSVNSSTKKVIINAIKNTECKKKPTVIEKEVRETEDQETEVQESTVQETEVQESTVQETEVQETEVQETEVQETEVQETEVQETEDQESTPDIYDTEDEYLDTTDDVNDYSETTSDVIS